MDAEQFELAMGKPEESPEVSDLLKALGVTKKLKLGPEGYTVLDLPDHGLVLSFKPVEAKTSRLKLTGVQFMAGTDKKFKPYAGTLPRGLSFGDSQKEARAKLGKPTKIMKDFNIDRWEEGGRLLSITYKKKPSDGLGIVQLHFPRQA